MKYLSLLLLTVSLWPFGCGANESEAHARNTVELLRKLRTQITSKADRPRTVETLVEAKLELQKVKEGELKPETYIKISMAVKMLDVFMDSIDHIDNPQIYRGALESYKSGVRWCEEAADDLGMDH